MLKRNMKFIRDNEVQTQYVLTNRHWGNYLEFQIYLAYQGLQ